ncbi:DUF370 domain-containing protein [Bacillaceae bacterium S4-13-56]
MFIPIGEDYVIELNEVIAMIDHQLLLSSTIIQEMIQNQRKEKKIIEISNGSTKSIVITPDQIYFSPLSVATLKKRSSMTNILSKLDDYSNID